MKRRNPVRPGRGVLARAGRRRSPRRRVRAGGNHRAVKRSGAPAGGLCVLWFLALRPGTAAVCGHCSPRRHPHRGPSFRADSAARARPRRRPRSRREVRASPTWSAPPATAREQFCRKGKESYHDRTTKTLVKDKDSGKGKLTTSAMGPAKAPVSAPAPASAVRQIHCSGSPMRHSRRKPAGGSAEGGGEAGVAAIRRGANGNASRDAEGPHRRPGRGTSRKLENDFYAWDDGYYRDRVIKPAWDRA